MAPQHLQAARDLGVPPPPGHPYSVPLPGTEEPDRTPIYRHWRFKDRDLLKALNPSIRTAHDLFEVTASQQPKARCFGSRPWDSSKKAFGPYEWQDYGTVARRRANAGVGLLEVHKKAGITGAKYGVGIWCQNRPEWHIIDFACNSQSLYTVSLYDTLGPTAIEFIANHASLASIATSLNHIPALFSLKPRLPHLKIIICLDPMEAGEQPGQSKFDVLSTIGANLGVAVYSLAQLEALGDSLGPVKFNPPDPEDTVTINYTSGTTGNPKGVLLSHRAAVAAVATSASIAALQPSDVGLSYLPLAHIYGRMVEQSVLFGGGSIGFFHGNILELVDDLKLIRPTVFYSVPRLYNRFGGAIRAATLEQGGVRGALSRHVVATKLASLEEPEAPRATNRHALYDRIWGRKVSAAIGMDRAHSMVSGSAPLDPTLHRFLRVVFGNNFLQGFGMTETYAVGLAQLPGDQATGTCGAVSPGHEVCLLSVPDMDYLVTDRPDPRGELLIRGETLFSGYFRDAEETRKAMLPGGWFKTGDIASIDARGRVRIVDRRKNVLKLAQGEYVSPERLEGVYLAALSYLATAYVHGDSLQTSLVAVFGVAPDRFAPFAAKVLERPIRDDDVEAIRAACQHEKVRKAVQKDLDRVGAKNKFAGFEKVKACVLKVDPFTIDNDLLTPTLKLKRPQAAKAYRKELDALYEEVLSAEQQRSKL